MSDPFVYFCPACQIGYCQPGQATYVRLVEGVLVTMPETPVWTCDICGYQEFDSDALVNLDLLLGVTDSTAEAQRPRPADNYDQTGVRRLKS